MGDILGRAITVVLFFSLLGWIMGLIIIIISRQQEEQNDNHSEDNQNKIEDEADFEELSLEEVSREQRTIKSRD